MQAHFLPLYMLLEANRRATEAPLPSHRQHLRSASALPMLPECSVHTHFARAHTPRSQSSVSYRV